MAYCFPSGAGSRITERSLSTLSQQCLFESSYRKTIDIRPEKRYALIVTRGEDEVNSNDTNLASGH